MNEAAAVVVGLESPPFRHRHAASHLVFDTVCFAAVIRCVITSRATAVTPGNDGGPIGMPKGSIWRISPCHKCASCTIVCRF